MHSPIIIFLLGFISTLGFSQHTKYLASLKITNEFKQIFVLMDSDGTVLDTIIRCPSSYKVVDSFVQSIDSVSVIFENSSHYIYMQMLKDKNSAWVADSTANWGKPNSLSNRTNTTHPNIYKLIDYTTIVKIAANEVQPFTIPNQKVQHEKN